jgi:hypothetical protein
MPDWLIIPAAIGAIFAWAIIRAWLDRWKRN